MSADVGWCLGEDGGVQHIWFCGVGVGVGGCGGGLYQCTQPLCLPRCIHSLTDAVTARAVSAQIPPGVCGVVSTASTLKPCVMLHDPPPPRRRPVTPRPLCSGRAARTFHAAPTSAAWRPVVTATWWWAAGTARYGCTATKPSHRCEAIMGVVDFSGFAASRVMCAFLGGRFAELVCTGEGTGWRFTVKAPLLAACAPPGPPSELIQGGPYVRGWSSGRLNEQGRGCLCCCVCAVTCGCCDDGRCWDVHACKRACCISCTLIGSSTFVPNHWGVSRYRLGNVRTSPVSSVVRFSPDLPEWHQSQTVFHPSNRQTTMTNPQTT